MRSLFEIKTNDVASALVIADSARRAMGLYAVRMGYVISKFVPTFEPTVKKLNSADLVTIHGKDYLVSEVLLKHSPPELVVTFRGGDDGK